MTPLGYWSAWELQASIAKGDLSPLELMRTTLARIEAVDAKLNAFVALRPKAALDEAYAAEDRLADLLLEAGFLD